MTDQISCESWETGTPFLGIPSKFVVVSANGEVIGTLDDVLSTLLYKDGNLSELADKAISRENLGVYSIAEINDLIPVAATSESSGTVKIIDNLTSDATDATITAKQGKLLNEKIFGAGSGVGYAQYTRSLNTQYELSSAQPSFANITATVANQGTFIELRTNGGTLIGRSGTTFSGGRVSISAMLFKVIPYKLVQVGSGLVTIDSWTETV